MKQAAVDEQTWDDGTYRAQTRVDIPMTYYLLTIYVDGKVWTKTKVAASSEIDALVIKTTELEGVFVAGVTVQVESRHASKRFVQNKDTQDGISDLSIDAIERSRSNGGPANRTAGG